MTLEKDSHLKNQVVYITNDAYDELHSTIQNNELIENVENKLENEDGKSN